MLDRPLVSYQGKKWPTDLEATVKLEWESGLSASQIGALHGMTRNAIIGKIHRLNLPERPKDTRKKSAVVVTRKKRIRKYIPPKPKPVDVPTAIQLATKLEIENPGISLLSLTWLGGKPANCRAVIRKDADGMALYCGEPTVDGASFCDCHSALYYNYDVRKGSRPFRIFR